ncbi:hypothetical protein B0H11DRAFT_1983375 [Mycena galericulata]|nr:hypothetical protein B0H11DRAFT_1983375 [Mycena galericulata]
MSFFPKVARTQHVPSTVKAPATVNSGSLNGKNNPAKITPKTPVAPVLFTSVPSSPTIRLLNQLRGNVALLPSTLAMADDTNPLSVFSGEPTTYVPSATKPGDLWEALNDRAFDYGMGLDARVAMVQPGPLGLHGLLRFLEYFIGERGLEGGMVELKIEQMIEAVKSVLKSNGISGPSISDTPMDQRARTVIDVNAKVESPPMTRPAGRSATSKPSPVNHTRVEKSGRGKTEPCGDLLHSS